MRKTLFAVTLVALFGGCATDFDVIAPYKEVMVIDGLLNTFDSVQNVRISKAFLGEGDAYIMAQQKDSINYADILAVTMTDLSNGSQFSLTRNEQNNKDTGTFAAPFVVLYTTNHPIDPDNKYRIDVTNTVTGFAASSETKIVGDIRISPPIPADSVDFASSFPQPILVSYEPGDNSFVDEFRLRFHYREMDLNGVWTMHYVDWNLGAPASRTSLEVKYKFFKNDFFINLTSGIPDKPGYIRRVDSLGTGIETMEYVFIEGSEDLDTYINLNKPSTGVVTDKPLFTTVENGIGLFTSRLIHNEFREIDQDTRNYITVHMPTKGFQF